ncbi:hypothetical protein IL54_4888 [Sphingobium sp. ba1]|nr:hypothetical protein IL54_4888 [Sphingobium sp. ba1]
MGTCNTAQIFIGDGTGYAVADRTPSLCRCACKEWDGEKGEYTHGCFLAAFPLQGKKDCCR